jgi:hypothetical protein
MLNLLVRYRIITNRGSGVIAGNFIDVYWDDVDEDLEVQQFDNAADTTGTVITSGPDLGADRIDHTRVTSTPIPYSFCDGVDLQTFVFKSTFPYVTQVSTASHFSCIDAVCDLAFSDAYNTITATDFTTSDGGIEVTATSSNGVIKYSLDPNFNYATQGQTSGLFLELFAGTYTVTAKDELGCFDQITVNVPVPDFYNPLYRLEYTDRRGTPTRVDVLQRGYEGEPIEVTGDGDPVILKYNGDGDLDKFTSIIPSQLDLTLMNTREMGNFYFRDLFTQDDRKYQIKYYKDLGNTLPGFTPAVMDTLDNWLDTGAQWTIDSTPSLSPMPSVTSSALYTEYVFEAGQEYSFSYDFTWSVPSGTFFSYITIEITNSIGADLGANARINLFSEGSLTVNRTGTHTFIAPAGADRIRFVVRKKAIVTSPLTFTVNSFTNDTLASDEQSSGYELKWLGYVITSNYKEAYMAPPYSVTITATDGLVDLRSLDFLDPNDLTYREDIVTIKAISDILKKTDLGINIQVAVNRFEENMDQTASDDPLSQCKFNPKTFYHGDKIKNCYDTLSEIPRPFGARILQRNGKWIIASIEELVTDTVYREFNSNGDYVTNGTFNDTVNIDVPTILSRAAFANRDQFMEVVPSFGKMFFEHTLLKNESLLESYSFEPEDLVTFPDGKKGIKGWNINIVNSPGAVYGIKETKAFEGAYNFYLQYPPSPRGGGSIDGKGSVYLRSSDRLIEFESVDAFEFRFSYSCLLTSNQEGGSRPLWVKLKWRLQVGDVWYNETFGGWTDDLNLLYNEIYIDRYNETLDKKVTAKLPGVSELTEDDFLCEFIITNKYTYDFVDTTALKAKVTTTEDIGSKQKVKSSVSIMSYYELIESTAAESLPNIVRPNDFASSTNEKVWELQRSSPVRGSDVSYVYLDNVVLNHFPDGAEPPENITIQKDNNPGIKLNYEGAYLLNDVDLENINNSERTYKNFFKLLDGTPTQVWERTYRPGTGKLLALLSNDFASQYKTPCNKLTGSFDFDTVVLPTSILTEVNDSNKKYMFMGYELHDKNCIIGFDILELKDTITDPDSGDIDAGFSTGFSIGFRS